MCTFLMGDNYYRKMKCERAWGLGWGGGGGISACVCVCSCVVLLYQHSNIS